MRKQFDVFGIMVLAWAAGLGGGMLRDVLIGAVPPVGISNWRFIATAVAGATLIYFFHPRLERARRFIVVLDAGALALFSVVGTIKGLEYGTTLTAAVIVGVMTGSAGECCATCSRARCRSSLQPPAAVRDPRAPRVDRHRGPVVAGRDHDGDQRGHRDRRVRAARERPALPAEGARAVAGDRALTARCEDGRVNLESPDQVRTLMKVAETLAREAGALVRDGRRRLVTVAATKSSDQDVVTAMDLASEKLLRSRLAQLRPDDAILGEEEAFRPGTSGITWVVDPIDGTVNYLYGSPAYAVSVAAVVGPDPTAAPDPATWTALAGCVFAPEDGRTFLAGRGLGATLDATALRVGEARPLIDSPRRDRLRIRRVEATGAGANRRGTVAAGT